MPYDYVKAGYLEGDTFKDPVSGKQVILQVDGTVRDASIKETPKPVDYVEMPKKETTPAYSTVDPNVQASGANQKTMIGGKTYYSPALGKTISVSEADIKANPALGFISNDAYEVQPGYTPPGSDATGGVKYNADGTRTLSADEQAIADYYNALKPKSAEDIAAEEAKIREEKLKQQQEAINGINAMYDNLLAQINREGEGRLGSTATITALSGQRGSASGLAQEEEMKQYNSKIVKANEAERNAKISQIVSDYKNQISNEIASAKKLRTEDAEKWLTYKSGEVDRNRNRSLELRKQFLAAGLKPEDIDDKTYAEIAKAAGYTTEQAKALYKNEYDSAQSKFVNDEKKKLAEIEKIKAETAKITADANVKKSSQDVTLAKSGLYYISTPEQRKQYQDAGRIVTKVGDREYVLKDNIKTKVITKGNNNVLINATTGEEIKNLGVAKTKVGGKGSSKNYTATTIPGTVKKDLLYDKGTGRSAEELMNAYPEVSTSYIQSLFAKPGTIQF